MHSAVTITGREQAELLPVVPDPAPLAPEEVMGRTLATVISAGTELAAHYGGERFPVVPGYASVFRVEAVAANVTQVQTGDVAFCMGPHRSFQRVQVSDLTRVPEGLPPQQAAFARLLGVGMATLTTTRARPPERVVVLGLGPVGNGTAQAFRACGYEVLGCDPSPVRRDVAERCGLATVATREDAGPGWLEKAALAVECSGHEGAALDACRFARSGGEVVLVGAPWRPRTDLTAHALLHLVFFRDLTLRGGSEWQIPLHPEAGRPSSTWENFAAALRWLAAGKVTVDGLYTVYEPRECQRAYEDLQAERVPFAAVFDWTINQE